MSNVDSVVPVLTEESKEDALINTYLQCIKDLKAKNLDDQALMTQALKDKTLEVQRVKTEMNRLQQQAERHEQDFQRFRLALKELKQLAQYGEMDYEVLHGPEIQALSKQNEKLRALYEQSRDRANKLDERCQAMSAQVIDRQKRLYQLEEKLLNSEQKRHYLEQLVQSKVKSGAQESGAEWLEMIKAFIESIPSRIPSWMKT